MTIHDRFMTIHGRFMTIHDFKAGRVYYFRWGVCKQDRNETLGVFLEGYEYGDRDSPGYIFEELARYRDQAPYHCRVQKYATEMWDIREVQASELLLYLYLPYKSLKFDQILKGGLTIESGVINGH